MAIVLKRLDAAFCFRDETREELDDPVRRGQPGRQEQSWHSQELSHRNERGDDRDHKLKAVEQGGIHRACSLDRGTGPMS